MEMRMKKYTILLLIMVVFFTGIEVYATNYNSDSGILKNEKEDATLSEVEYLEDYSETDKNDEFIAEEKGLANSWRFSDGQLITDNSRMSKARSSAYHPEATLQGIDVSEFQGNIDWDKVKASGIDFAILRCGYGMNQSDQDDVKFLRNAKECERLGIPYGVYLYSYATNTSRASSEADHVLRLLKGRTLSYPVYFDMEDSSTLAYRSSFDDIAKTFCNKISNAGYAVGVYANLNWWNTYLTDSCFDSWHKWVAQYYSTCQYKKDFAIWQYTSSGYVDGISGRVDMNYQIGYPADHGINLKAVDIEEGTYTISSKANEDVVLGVKDSSIENNADIEVMSAKQINANQRFELIKINDKQYKVLAEHSGKALDVRNSNKNPGAEMQQYEWHEANAQIWEFVDAGDGYYYMRSKLGTYLKLETSNGNIVTTGTFNKEDAQKWKLTISNQQPIEDGIYNIISANDENNSIDVEDFNINDKVPISLDSFNGSISQQYSISYVGNGYYKITAEHSNKVFDVANGSKDPGASLQQYRDNGSNAQLWKFVDAGDGKYYVKSKLGNTISLSGDKSVILDTMNFTVNQKWILKPVELEKIEEGIYSLRNKKNSSYAMTQLNDNIQVKQYDNILEQKYKIEHVKNGYYKISDISTGMVLDVENGSKNSGANLQTHVWNETDAQLWRFVEVGKHEYVVKSKLGKFIDIAANNVSEDCNVYLYDFTNSDKQKWKLSSEKVIYVDNPDISTEEKIERIFSNNNSVRYAGGDRYDTAIMAADALKKSENVDKFENIIIACGFDYPDALSGGFLAKEKKAPILLVDEQHKTDIVGYIKKNLEKNGKVYILGGTGAVSSNVEKSLKKFTNVERVYGSDRYGTNLAILREGKLAEEELLICSGEEFADALSVSSLGKPVMLVKDEFTDEQLKYLKSISIKRIYLIGGSGAVSRAIESESNSFGKVERVAGMNRYTTSVSVAKAFTGDWSKSVVLVDGRNFPDGLSGGALAVSITSPVLLVDNEHYKVGVKYIKDTNINKLIVMGGPTLIGDHIIKSMLN